jgi:iron complex outermembrane receptor protein
LDLETEVSPASTDTALVNSESLSPKNQYTLSSSWNLGNDWEIDARLRHVDELPKPGGVIPAYETLDLRVGKQIGRGWEVSVVGQNLLEKSHPEFRVFTVRAAVARGFYVRVEWRH